MLDRLGLAGIAGFVLVLVGLALVAVKSPLIAAGLALVLVGLGLAVKSLVSGLLSTFGMGGMF
ncbi:DUF7470 family protein [Halalkalicoccus jeotgali]|uniref:Uncharacterized protein n=1 Tax=Halalkalicoccus jeotgali (strain DSM 18796 / CECT 7217 / JCM 14584 / KCTC 4019 / B3) TaxID=795797 RepID=D8J825_HALJB|nr:hypothetical protein [Halalkalicoccus jeotgali]ADJ14138.1 hypothetical protein HacjB3_03735 [Halalkalicoccus jeotgali B3]ELY34680.1 hypothetical protein C497_15558 [Halalkalicoccus jeotgali B3]